MAERKLNPKPFFIIGIAVVVLGGGYLILGGGGGTQNYYEFAECLANESATMYGFDACPHCNRQKALIGQDAFQTELTDEGYYVKCRPESEASRELGDAAGRIASVQPLNASTTQGEACTINVGAGTPTWVIDGEKYVGEQSLATLAEATGCPLPESYQGGEDVGGFTPEEGQ